MSLMRSSTIDGVVRRSARAFGDRVALVFGEREWTYRELEDATSRAAAALLAQGLTKGDRVAAFGRNSDAYLLGFLACARAGLVHVPLNYNLTGYELEYLVTQSGSSLVLADPDLVPRLDDLEAPVPSLPLRDAEGSLLDAARTGEVPEIDVEVADDDLAQLLYTSGTTSRPKGAMMTHRSLVAEYLSCVVALDLAQDDEPLHVMPLYHSAQMHVFLLPWLAVGARSTLLEVPEPGEILARIERDGHRAFFAAPTLWVAMTNHADFAGRDLASLRKAYYGASIMPGPVVERLQAKMPELGLYNCFGQSEMGPLCTVLRPEEHAERPDSAGRPVLLTEMRVVDGEGRDVAPGEMGEVVYRSPQLCLGYWDKPQETAEAFVDGWFHSGDLVRVDEQGYITVVDRIKDVINSGGVLIASREVEDALFSHPAVAEAAVIGTPDERWVEAVTAVVVLQDEVSTADLLEHARTRLAGFKVPKSVHVVDELPKNTSGKILKRQLRDELA
ncbi:fatty acyl-CoA synthetase [Janibacter melonis]|uniref:fatty acyl-CoA synthetase n=1 Tax=Janibacter melonis TaxID=262209 RepID=UPI0020432566|nr:fatty acyl-CoA synthetase [Janibacter melonis]MCM3556554.1 fatty acyl-CoA synthetase [Janibacter melonis]